MPPSQSPNLTRPNQADVAERKDNIVEVVLQQGKPILDVDFNLAQKVVRNAITQAMSGLNGVLPTSPNDREYAIRPVTRDAIGSKPGVHPRNSHNLAFNLGRLHTRLGLIDSIAARTTSLLDFAVFDYQRLLDLTATVAEDNPYENYLFRGAVTAAGAGETTNLVDENKRWTTDHRLTGFSDTVLVDGTTTATYPWNPSGGAAVDPFQCDLTEPAARVVFLTGLNAGKERTVTTLASSTQLALSSALPNPLAEGDTYIIVPGNALTLQKTRYDARTAAQSFPVGLAGPGVVCAYVHAYLEDLSSEEEPRILEPVIPAIEPTHRTQLRWCMRTVILNLSFEAFDAGRQFFHPVHLANLLINKATGDAELFGADIPSKGRVSGAAGTIQDGDDLTSALTSTIPAGTTETFLGSDVSLNDYSAGITRQHKLTRTLNSFSGDYVSKAIKAVFDSLISTPTEHEYLPMIFVGAPTKNADAQVLDEYFFPNVTVDVPATTVPRLVTDNSKTLNAQVSFLASTTRKTRDIAAVATDLDRARSLGWHNPGFSGNTLLDPSKPARLFVDDAVTFNPTLVFGSLSEHLGWLDALVLGMSGIGNALGVMHPLSSDAGNVAPTNKNFLPTAAANTIAQSGHSTVTFQASAASLLNPAQELQGSVFPLDVLSGSGTPISDVNTFGGSFISGPAQYKTRGGLTINPNSTNGWGFFEQADDDLEDTTTNRANFNPRQYQQGIAQAVQAQRALDFRKLAVKTSAHICADLFTIDVKPPTLVTEPESFFNDGGTLRPEGGALTGAGTASGFGASAVGAFQDMTAFSNVTTAGLNEGKARQVAHSGYNNAGSYLQTDKNALRNSGQAEFEDANLATYGGAGGQAIERWNYNRNGFDPGGGPQSGQIDGFAKISETQGAWGRFPVQPDKDNGGLLTQPNMLDQWSNRCTAARMRYHVGDYYPGPADDKGVLTNALVDTLKLFVRVEPLPLVHWATMPRHSHPIIEGSISFLESIKTLLESSFRVAGADVSGFFNTDTDQAVVTANSPSSGLDFGDGELNVGDVDPYNLPFEHKHQLFVHWYHVFQEKITAPHPFNGSTSFPTDPDFVPYRKFGERSLIVPALSFSTPNIGLGLETGENFGRDLADVTAPNIAGDHFNAFDNSATTRVVNIGIGDVTISSNDTMFPYVPEASQDANAQGAPGPVFMMASRTYARDIAANEIYGVHKIFEETLPSWGNAAEQDEFSTWPSIDEEGTTNLDSFPNLPGDIQPYKVPVLRAALRSDTIAAIFGLFSLADTINLAAITGVSDLPGNEAVTPAQKLIGTGPDFTTEPVHIGDTGTGIMLDAAGRQQRSFFQNGLWLGMPANPESGLVGMLADARNAATTIAHVNDVFELAVFERALAFGLGDTAFLPLLNTFVALNNQGLQQKLLWNSSLRVMHFRPGGGFRPGTGGPRTFSSRPLSLTELFLVRNRQTGAPVAWPTAPSGPDDKPFIHLESMHPAAQGGAGFNAHPNNAFMSHLYPMVSDSMGGPSTSAPASSDPLWDESATPNHYPAPAEYALQEFGSGAAGDCFVGDPFDYEISTRTAVNQATTSNVPKTDRGVANSGMEIDLVSELRFVRENATAHGLDLAGLNGLTLLDTMPSVGELTAPGDHEIVIVLYPGSYGQKMIDPAVPAGYNPPVAGCRVVASIEVNRPSENVGSADGGTGQLYGESREVFNILGHG